eukprot:12932564-Prorocentrum_lima.AAC.1
MGCISGSTINRTSPLLVEQKWQERLGKKEPRAPAGSLPPNAETVRVIESLARRLGQGETNQDEMKLLRRMSD